MEDDADASRAVPAYSIGAEAGQWFRPEGALVSGAMWTCRAVGAKVNFYFLGGGGGFPPGFHHRTHWPLPRRTAVLHGFRVAKLKHHKQEHGNTFSTLYPGEL